MTQTLLMLLIRCLPVTLQICWGCSYIISFIKCCWDTENKCQKPSSLWSRSKSHILLWSYSFPIGGYPNWFVLYRPKDTSGIKQWKSCRRVSRALRCYTFILVAITTLCLTVPVYCGHTLQKWLLPGIFSCSHLLSAPFYYLTLRSQSTSFLLWSSP